MYVHTITVPTWGRYAAVLLLLLIGVGGYAQTMGGGNASISLSPSSGPPGTTISVSVNGANWDFIDGSCAANGSTFYTVPDIAGNSINTTYAVPGNASGTINISCNISLFMSGGEVQDQQTVSAGFTVTGGQQNNDGGGQQPPPDAPPPPPDNAGDADRDGVPDDADRCPFVSGRGDQFGGVSGADGCPVDSDGDGANDGVDACPFDPSRTGGQCGGPQDDFDPNAAIDSDGDGVPDSADDCPNTPGGGTADGCPQDDPQPVIVLPTLPEDGTCYVATPGTTPVNVRQGPSVTTNIVGGLNPANFYPSQFVEVNPQGETWYSVTSEQGNPGYVRSDVVRGSSACANLSGPQDDGSGLVPDLPTLPEDGTCYIATPDIAPVDVYEQPDQSSGIIGQMNPQTVYESLFRAMGPQGNAYYTVTLSPGVDGFVFIPDVRGTAPCGNTPAVPGQQQAMLGSGELCMIRSRDGSDLDVFSVTTIEDRRAGSFFRDTSFDWYRKYIDATLPGNRPYFPIGVDGFTEVDRGVTRVEGRAYLVDTYTPRGQVRGFINQADVIVENPELCSDLPAVEGAVRERVSAPMVAPPTSPNRLFNYVGGTEEDITLPPQCGNLQESFDDLPGTMRIVLLNERDDLSEEEQCDLAESLIESVVFRERLSSFSQNWLDDAAECPADFMALAAYAERIYSMPYSQMQTEFENILNANENLCGIAGQLASGQFPTEFQTITRIEIAAAAVCAASPGLQPAATAQRMFNYPAAPAGETPGDFLRSGQPGGELCRQTQLVNRIGNPNAYIQTAYTELTETCDYPRLMENAGGQESAIELVADMRRQNVDLAIWQENLNCADPTAAIELAEPHPVVASRSADIPPALAECRTIAQELANNSQNLSVGELYTIFNSSDPCETANDYVQTLVSPGVFESFQDLRCSVGPNGESNVPGVVDEDLRLGDSTIIIDDAPYSTKALLASQDHNGLCNGDPVVRNLGASAGSGDTIASDVSDLCWGVMLGGSLPARQGFTHPGFPLNAALATHVQTADGPVRIPETHLQRSELIPWDGTERFLTFTAYVPQPDEPNRYPILVLANHPTMDVEEIFFGEVPDAACVSGEFPLDYVTQQTGANFNVGNQGNIEPADPDYTISPEMFNPDIQRVEFDLELAPPDVDLDPGTAASSATTDDLDGDDIPNDQDLCPNEAAPNQPNGCPPDGDQDGDGVINANDNCPNTPGPDNVVGCPLDESDPDGDGIPTYADDCPTQAGIVQGVDQVNGCPADYDPNTDADGDGLVDVADEDGDSITNNKDQCPFAPGRTAAADPTKLGCPEQNLDPSGDADRDGIPNNVDSCAFTPGVQQQPATINGCPQDISIGGDQDNDGIPTYTDACHTEAGPPNDNPELNGCPPNSDQDGDGVPNIMDDCPVNAGVQRPDTDLNGCPAAVASPVQPDPQSNIASPDADEDGDGVPDSEDACPSLPAPDNEVGCPLNDADPDGDGVPNYVDSCPNLPGEYKGMLEINGCPEGFDTTTDADGDGLPDLGDADGDGVPNNKDQCVNEPASEVNSSTTLAINPERIGCPAAAVTTPVQPGGGLPNPNTAGAGGGNLPQPGGTNNTGSNAQSGGTGASATTGGGSATNVSTPPSFSNPAPRPPVYGGFTQPTVNTSSDTAPGAVVAAPDTSPVYVQPAGNNIQANTPPALEDENQIGATLLALTEESAELGNLSDAYGVFGVSITEGENVQSNIYTFENGELTPLFEPSDDLRVFPVVSPSGEFIAYLRNRNDGGDIAVMLYSREGDLTVPLFEATPDLQPAPIAPVWMPDGSALLVTMTDADGNASIYQLDARSLSSQPELLVENGSSPSIGTNGRNLAFVRPKADDPTSVDVILRSLTRDAETTLTDAETGYQCYAPGFGQDSITVYFLCTSAQERATGLFKYGVGGIEQILIETGATSGIQPGPANGLLTYAAEDVVYFVADTGEGITPLLELGENVLVDSISWQSNSNPIPSLANLGNTE